LSALPNNLPANAAPQRLAYSIKDAAEACSVPAWTIHTAITEGRLVAKPLGKRWVITRPDLETFLKNLPAAEPSQQWLEKRKKMAA